MEQPRTTSKVEGKSVEHNRSAKNMVTVVLTPGRSGSSLLMEILGNLGLTLSDELLSGRLENPHGFFEDARVVEIHKNLMSEVGARAGFPMPQNWLDQPAARHAKRALTDLVREQVSVDTNGWALKDPRICELLPLWLQVFNSAGVTPRFILALRDPAAVASSLRRGVNRDERLTELQWLYRTTHALYHTASDCFLVHYEDWFTRPVELGQALGQYCGFEGVSQEKANQAVQASIEERLNRSSFQEYEVRHPLVKRLYATLRRYSGADFDRAPIMEVVRESAGLIEGFSWWGRLHPGAVGKQSGANGEPTKGRQAAAGSGVLEDVLGYHRILRELKECEDEVNALRTRIYGDPRGAVRTESHSDSVRLEGLKASVRYRLGDVLVRAIKNPGRDTFAMPVRVLRLAREGLRRRRAVVRGDIAVVQQDGGKADRKVRGTVQYRLGEIIVLAVARPGRNTLAAPVRVVRLFREVRRKRRLRHQGAK